MNLIIMRLKISWYAISVIIIILTSGNLLIAQEVPTGDITGLVRESDTGEPLQFVNVWLSNTTLGSATNENGLYTIRNVPFGRYVLVVSHVTHSPQRKDIQLSKPLLRVASVRMKEVIYDSGEVVVSATDLREWEKNYKKFIEDFIGISNNASHCEVINPEVLTFNKDAGGYTAQASGLLKIVNNSLGYHINYLLVQFIKHNDMLQFSGEPQFVEMIPSDDQEMELWRENRLKSYRGSLRHFLASLYAQTSDGEGFLMHQLKKLPSDDMGKRVISSLDVRFVYPNTLVESTGVKYLKELKFEDYLQVEYRNERADNRYINQYQRDKQRIAITPMSGLGSAGSGGSIVLDEQQEINQVSWIRISSTNTAFNTYGISEDPYFVRQYGYWTFDRIAELLPFDYRPSDN